MEKKNKINSVVKIFQKLKQWQKKADISSQNLVPPGHVAVSVGEYHRRYVVRMEHLNHPIFEKLLKESEEKYGFSNVGILAIPCEESLFENIIETLNRFESSRQGKEVTLEDIQSCDHVELPRYVENFGESWPLLHENGEQRIVLN